MVDPNPARGMPLQLQRYWLTGKGAAKIRWGVPHDFNRCVRNLRKYFPKNPQGLCNILHQKALGAPPGKGHPGEASITFSAGLMITDRDALVAAQELMDKQPKLGQYTWAGPLAPVGRPTQEPSRIRVFEPGALRHRMLPLPLDWRERVAPGHEGAVTVGRQLGIVYGPDHTGLEYAWAWGDFLDEEIIPDVKKARHLTEMGVAGTSVDPGGRIVGMLNPETGATHMSEFTIGGATLVPIPAFSAMRMYVFDADGDWPDDDPDMMEDLVGMTVVAQTQRQRFWLRVRHSRSTHPDGGGYPWHLVMRSLTMTTRSSGSLRGPTSVPRVLTSISSGAHSCGTTRTSPRRTRPPTGYR
jgi:hypothetical protein